VAGSCGVRSAASGTGEVPMRSLLLSLAAMAISASAAQAVVLQIDFSIVTTGIPDPAVGTVVIDGPFDADVLNSSIGVTASGFNFDLDESVVYNYLVGLDQLTIGGSIGGGAAGVLAGTNDFRIQIDDFLTMPVATSSTLLVQADQGFIGVDAPTSVTVGPPGGTEPPPVDAIPLPAGALLLLSATGAMVLAGKGCGARSCRVCSGDRTPVLRHWPPRGPWTFGVDLRGGSRSCDIRASVMRSGPPRRAIWA
jgi:hypothetical protein